MSYHSMGNALKAFRNGSLGADATYVYGGSASTSSGISLPSSTPKAPTLNRADVNVTVNPDTGITTLQQLKPGTFGPGTSYMIVDGKLVHTADDPSLVRPNLLKQSDYDKWLETSDAPMAVALRAGMARDAQAAEDANPKIVLQQGPRPVSYDLNGKHYTAPAGAYIGHDPSNLYCQAGNTAPCACATQELKDYILSSGLCSVTSAPQIKGIGAQTAYSAYGASGQPAGTFKWFDKWFTATDGFNPCDVLRLPTCKVDCNAPWYEPVRLAGNYGYCKSTHVDQPTNATTAYTVYTPRAPIQAVAPCPKGKHASSGGCVDDLVVGDAPTTAPASSSFLTGGWWLLLLAAAGGGYYLYTRNQKKGAK